MTFEEFKQKHQEQVIARRQRNHEEDDLQKQCVRWFRDSYPEAASLLFHPNNEPYFGGYGRSEVQKAKAGRKAINMGVTPGVADLILLLHEHWPTPYNGGAHALCIEMKATKGTQRESQKQWQLKVEDNGNRYVLCRSFEEFRQLITSYIDKPPLDDAHIFLNMVRKKSQRVQR